MWFICECAKVTTVYIKDKGVLLLFLVSTFRTRDLC